MTFGSPVFSQSSSPNAEDNIALCRTDILAMLPSPQAFVGYFVLLFCFFGDGEGVLTEQHVFPAARRAKRFAALGGLQSGSASSLLESLQKNKTDFFL